MRLFSSNDRLEEYLFNKGLIKRGDSLALAVSGGADSVAMLLFFHNISKENDLRLQVKHFEHGIRGKESIEDMEYVKNLCETLKIPFVCKNENIPQKAKELGLSVEEAARKLRYDFLLEGDFDALLVAHNYEDRAETVLFNLIRGTGVDGLIGIKEESFRGGKRIVRPLLKVQRKEIERFLAEKNVDYREDSTNKSLEYSRNKIRNVLIPLLEEINPRAVAHINAASEDIGDIKADYDNEMEKLYSLVRAKDGLDVKSLQCMPENRAKYFIRKYIFETVHSLKDISRIHIDKVYSLLFKESGKSVDIPGYTVENTYGIIHIRGKEKEVESFDSLELTYKTRIFDYKKAMEIPKDTYTKWFDYDKITSVFSLRTPLKGDYFTINSRGDKKAFNRFCIDEKIPREERMGIPLFCLDNHIIWAVGYRISEAFKITESTTKVIEISFEGGEDGRND